MNTKEAIELVDCYFCKVISADEGKGIISLLQQGEKYRQTVEGFKEIFYTNPHNWVTKEYYADEIKKLEQKYFPKGK